MVLVLGRHHILFPSTCQSTIKARRGVVWYVQYISSKQANINTNKKITVTYITGHIDKSICQ